MILVLGFIIAMVVAGLVFSDANKRGMNGFGCCVGVFMMMVIFLPIYLIVRKPICVEKDIISVSDELLKLNELKEKGIISNAEFENQKSKLLN